MKMSTSCLSNRSRSSLSKPISSASLDSLMASSVCTDDEKFPVKKETVSLQRSLKRSADAEDIQIKSSSALKFTPSQLYKVRKTVKENINKSSSEKRGSTVSPSEETKTSPLDTISSSSVPRSCSAESTRSSKSETSLDETPNSSIYFTPENTPNTKFHVKRSLNDQFKDEDNFTPKSSLNCTAFYTPENSPNEYGSAVKKTRWNDSGISYNTDDEYLNLSHISSGTPNESVIQPELIGYQMIGDSQFCRFGQQLLGLQRVPMPNTPGRIGICVSGQTITDLHRRVKEKLYPISDKIIIMIGTNDFLRNVDVSTMCKELSALIRTLQETVQNIVLLTLPPIPKLANKQNVKHFMLLEKYNNHIRSLENGSNLRIADVSPMYMSQPPYQRCRKYLFEVYFPGPQRRFDMIHLNRKGLEVIRDYIREHFL